MFYSNRTQAIRSDRSHIEFDRIFCGQYWDEYGCIGLLGRGEDSLQVLMLGVGDGAAIRPILSSGRVCQLTCVDFDGQSLAGCKEIYAQNFPELCFSIVKAEAKAYLKSRAETFDVIVVDLYTRDSYAPVVFCDEFHKLLADRLKPGGHVAFNAYGIPMHLRPFEGKSAQAFLARRLISCWGGVRYLPYRRNATLIVGANELPGVASQAKISSLKLTDRVALQLAKVRLRSMPEVIIADASFDSDLTLHSSIDEEMRRRWEMVAPQINSFVTPHFQIEMPTDFLKLIRNGALCSELLNKLVDDDHELLPLLPILLAGEFNNHNIDADWLLNWTLEFLASQRSAGRQRFINFCLAQAFSIVINGKNNYLSQIFAFKEVIDALVQDADHEKRVGN